MSGRVNGADYVVGIMRDGASLCSTLRDLGGRAPATFADACKFDPIALRWLETCRFVTREGDDLVLTERGDEYAFNADALASGVQRER